MTPERKKEIIYGALALLSYALENEEGCQCDDADIITMDGAVELPTLDEVNELLSEARHA